MPLQQGDPAQVGRYRLTARLGSGGMGVVYLAQAAGGRPVAVKVLRPEYADDAEFRARFRREVAAMARVRNRYTVQVIDADTDSARPFLVTEFADGPSLAEHVKANGPLHPEATTRLAAALAEALAVIHAAGVTHRDLKPSNVLLTGGGPMVIDFGIAQVADSVSITRTGMAVGSPGYMAPEQLTGHAGREADVFTWALIVAFAASGQPPFGAGPTDAIFQRILHDWPDVSAVPPPLMPLVRAALAKDPKRRPTAAELLRQLSPGATITMVPQRGAAGEATRDVRDSGSEGAVRTRVLAGEPGPRRPGWLAPAIAAAVVVILAGTGVALADGGSHSGNGGKSPAPPATGPALSGTTSGTNTGAPARGPSGRQHVPPGQAKKNGGSAGDQTGAGDQPASSPSVSASPAAMPSTSASASVSASPGSAPSASASPGASGATAGGSGG